MKPRVFVGIDTSNYTTSAAVCDEEGHILCNSKQLLTVAEGERGLRQNDAVFQHVRNLPASAAALRETLAGYDAAQIAALGVSARPRDAEDSYMPCFLSGVAAAETAAALLGIPALRFSHQAGHVMAALHSAGADRLVSTEFAAFHVSGGTTDVLLVRPHPEFVFAIEKIGGTKDINAGQLIDRTGVLMGLRFPAGVEMERLAVSYEGNLPSAKLSVSGTECNLSGFENKAAALYASTSDKNLVSAYVLNAVGRTLCALRDAVRERAGSIPILYAGGVMSCRRLRKMLEDENSFFSEPAFSSDNAAGAALLARERFLKEGE